MGRVVNDMDVIYVARIFVESNLTLRRLAGISGVSRSTLHNYFRKYLKRISDKDVQYRQLYEDTIRLLDTNKAERAIRGGQATREMNLIRNVIH